MPEAEMYCCIVGLPIAVVISLYNLKQQFFRPSFLAAGLLFQIRYAQF